jgi:hypothetical protein
MPNKEGRTPSDPGDVWGRDPSVIRTRNLFSSMEKAQGDLLQKLAVSPLDGRLRPVREKTLDSFERVWALGTRKGSALDEKELTSLYLLCLAKGLVSEGIRVSPNLIAASGRSVALFEEAER